MICYSHLSLKFAAASGIAALLWTAAPAVAAENSGTFSQTAAKIAQPVIKNYASRRARIAAWRRDFRVNPIYGNLNCSNGWCGRQFVLMLGVAY
jgi:hypothetical protein